MILYDAETNEKVNVIHLGSSELSIEYVDNNNKNVVLSNISFLFSYNAFSVCGFKRLKNSMYEFVCIELYKNKKRK